MRALPAHALDAELVALGELLDERLAPEALLEGLAKGGGHGAGLVVGLDLGHAAAAGAVGGLDDERVGEAVLAGVEGVELGLGQVHGVALLGGVFLERDEQALGGGVAGRLEGAPHEVLVGGALHAGDGVARERELLGDVADGHRGEVARDGADAVDADLAADADDLVDLGDADGVEDVGGGLAHVAALPREGVDLAALLLGALDERHLEVGGADDGELLLGHATSSARGTRGRRR